MFHFGVQWYPEFWPEAGWPTEVRLMKEAGIRTVRLGEFAWSRMQPAENRFTWGWLDRALDLLHGAGIEAMLGVPVEAPTRWAAKKYPDLSSVSRARVRIPFGTRNHYCMTHPGMLALSTRLTREMAKRYANHPAVTWWQIGNELFKHQECYCDHCLRAWRQWLARRFGTIGALNEAWGTVFWSQEYDAFEDVVFPLERPNPGMILDYLRFRRYAVETFHKALTSIIRGHNPKARVTQNQPGFAVSFDCYSFAEDLDATGLNNSARDARDATDQQAKLDFCRSHKRAAFWVLEQGGLGISTVPEGLKPGMSAEMLRCWNWLALGSGAGGLLHYHWRQTPFGDEQYLGALLRHDGEPDARHYQAAKRFGNEVAPVAERLSDHLKPAQVAMVFDYESWWSNQSYRWKQSYEGLKIAVETHRWVRENGYLCDFLWHKDLKGLRDYRAVFIPYKLLLSEEELRAYEEFVKLGGTLAVGPRFGVKRPDNQVWTLVRPGIAAPLLGVEIREQATLPSDGSAACRMNAAGGKRGSRFAGRYWLDFLTPTTAAPLAHYDERTTSGVPGAAITVNRFGKGAAWTFGTHPDDAAGTRLVRRVLSSAGLKPEWKVPKGIGIGRRTTTDGKTLWVLVNVSAAPQEVMLPSPGFDVLRRKPVKEKCRIPRADVLVFEQETRR